VAEDHRNLGTIKQAAARLGVAHGTVRNYILKRRIYGERIGTGRWLVDLDEVDALRVEYHPVDDPNDVADAPPLTGRQIHTLRTLLHTAPNAASS
jgi:excisionase family DNA binding protein